MGLPQATLLLRAAAPDIKIVDVGAMDVGKDDATARLLKARKATVIGFEPVPEACARLNAGRAEARQTYLPFAIGDGRAGVFRECAYPMTSSLYEPNTALLESFQALAELAKVVKRTVLQTTRLDDIAEVAGADFLKMDVQGAELDVLCSGERLLASLWSSKPRSRSCPFIAISLCSPMSTPSFDATVSCSIAFAASAAALSGRS